MRISDWSSDVCSSDLLRAGGDRGSRAGLRRLVVLGTGARPGLRPGCGGLGADHRLPLCARPGDAAVDYDGEIGRAACRERVCQYVLISVVAVSLKKNTNGVHIKLTSDDNNENK